MTVNDNINPSYGTSVSTVSVPIATNDNNSQTTISLTKSPDTSVVPTSGWDAGYTSASSSIPGQTVSTGAISTSISSTYSGSEYSVGTTTQISIGISYSFSSTTFYNVSVAISDNVTGQFIGSYTVSSGNTSIQVPLSKQNLLNGVRGIATGTLNPNDPTVQNYSQWGYAFYLNFNMIIYPTIYQSFGTRTITNGSSTLIGNVPIGNSVLLYATGSNSYGLGNQSAIEFQMPNYNPNTYNMNVNTFTNNVINVSFGNHNSLTPGPVNYSFKVVSDSNNQEISVLAQGTPGLPSSYFLYGDFAKNQAYTLTAYVDTRDVVLEKKQSSIFPNRWETFTPTASQVAATNQVRINIPPHASGQITYTITSSIPLTNNVFGGYGEYSNAITVTGDFVLGTAYIFTVTASKSGESNIVASTNYVIPNRASISGPLTNMGSDATHIYYVGYASGTVAVTNGPISAEMVLVAGGGGGGTAYYGNATGGGGGGAGGAISASISLPTGNNSLVIGSGGPAIYSSTTPSNGTNSTFLGYTANGGGYGSYTNSSSPLTSLSAGSGGSGGGAGGQAAGGGVASAGSGTSGQGNSGGGSPGSYWNGNITMCAGGGGGGGRLSAGSSGASAPATDSGGLGGKGGDGIVPFDSSIVRNWIKSQSGNTFTDATAGVSGGGAGGSGKNYDYGNNNNWNSYTQIAQNVGGSWGASWNGNTYVASKYPTSNTGAGGYGNTFIGPGSPPPRTFTSGTAYYSVANGANGGLYLKIPKNIMGIV